MEQSRESYHGHFCLSISSVPAHHYDDDGGRLAPIIELDAVHTYDWFVRQRWGKESPCPPFLAEMGYQAILAMDLQSKWSRRLFAEHIGFSDDRARHIMETVRQKIPSESPANPQQIPSESPGDASMCVEMANPQADARKQRGIRVEIPSESPANPQQIPSESPGDASRGDLNSSSSEILQRRIKTEEQNIGVVPIVPAKPSSSPKNPQISRRESLLPNHLRALFNTLNSTRRQLWEANLNDMIDVWDAWRNDPWYCRAPERAKLDKRRAEKLADRFEDSAKDELLEALEGAKNDSWQQEHPEHRDLVTVFRDRPQIEKFCRLAHREFNGRYATGPYDKRTMAGLGTPITDPKAKYTKADWDREEREADERHFRNAHDWDVPYPGYGNWDPDAVHIPTLDDP